MSWKLNCDFKGVLYSGLQTGIRHFNFGPFAPVFLSFTQILELCSQYSDLKHEMERARRELEKHSKAREKKKSTSRVSVSSPISDTEMSSQMEMDQLKQQCTNLQDQNDVS